MSSGVLWDKLAARLTARGLDVSGTKKQMAARLRLAYGAAAGSRSGHVSASGNVRCGYNATWTRERPLDRERFCWACQPLVNPALRVRGAPCVNPAPYVKDAKGERLYKMAYYELERAEIRKPATSCQLRSSLSSTTSTRTHTPKRADSAVGMTCRLLCRRRDARLHAAVCRYVKRARLSRDGTAQVWGFYRAGRKVPVCVCSIASVAGDPWGVQLVHVYTPTRSRNRGYAAAMLSTMGAQLAAAADFRYLVLHTSRAPHLLTLGRQIGARTAVPGRDVGTCEGDLVWELRPRADTPRVGDSSSSRSLSSSRKSQALFSRSL